MRYCFKLLFFWAVLSSGLTNSHVIAQSRYWVEFRDKPAVTLPFSADHWTDAPVHTAYLDSLQQRGLQVSGTSKWLNAAAISATKHQAKGLATASYVLKISPIQGYFEPATQAPITPVMLSMAVAQMQPEPLLAAGLTGRGVKIGVIDAGFYGANQQPELQLLFQQDRIKAFRDFVNPVQKQPYTHRESSMDNHGTDVLMSIAGYDAKRQALIGLAPEADYYLARTEIGGRESRIEEEYFVQALEWLDSLGVRLVNSSLGYGTGFDKLSENYTPAQMNGTSLIARAAQIAVEQKGMTLVISAGNDGDKRNWQVINTPGDAPGVITVGSTDFSHWTRQGYSGIGPEFLSYLKPDLACYSATGTSFSAPIITGLAACLLQHNPDLTNQELSRVLRQSGHLYPFGNNYIGYGVPVIERALALAKGNADTTAAPLTVEVKGRRYSYRRPADLLVSADNGGIVLFHKKSATHVISQQKLPTRTHKIVVKRLPQEQYTTLQVGSQIIELVWR